MATKTIQIEKLRGRENYDIWKRVAQSYLTINNYWSCTKSEVTEATSEAIKDKHEKAMSELYLMIEPQLYPYIEDCDQVKQAWTALSNAFSDSGTSRKVFILQQFASTKYNDCASMENYVNTMTSLWAKVKAVGFKIDEEVAASLLLAGLPAAYQPMILGLENQKTSLTMDYVKNLLLQGAITKDDSADGALFSKGKHFSKKKKQVKCYNCGGPHFARKCNKAKNNKYSEKKEASANFCTNDNDMVLFSAFMNNNSNSWYFDSGATTHMCNDKKNFNNKRDPVKKNITTANVKKCLLNALAM